MKGKTSVILILLQLLSLVSFAQQEHFSTKKDLTSEWLVFDHDHYRKLENGEQPGGVRYCKLEPARYAGDVLYIASHKPFTLYINGQLITSDHGRKMYSLDSLKKLYDEPVWLVAVHQKILAQDIVLQIRTLGINQADGGPLVRGEDHLRNFAVVAILIALILLVTVVQINPKLALDYFSVTRVFSLRESDDSQVYTRISNSTNILVYILCSLMTGLNLLIIFHYTVPSFNMGEDLQSGSFWLLMFRWLMLSALILAMLFLKIFLVFIVSSLFGFRDVASIHFFNWIRVILITVCVMTLILSVYFVSRGQSAGFYSSMISFLVIMLSGITAILFFKLNGRVGQSIFHLFSYICATEVIPLFIIIKVLDQ